MPILSNQRHGPSLVNADEQIEKARSYAAAMKDGQSVDSKDVAYTLLVLAEFCQANLPQANDWSKA